MKNETEKSVLLSCGVFCFRIRASYGVTSPFRLTLGRDYCLSEKNFSNSGTIPLSRLVLNTAGKKNQSFFIQRV